MRWTALPWPARLLDALSSYLPMLLMGLLALGSWWLVKNTPMPEGPRVAAPLRHDADYTMRQCITAEDVGIAFLTEVCPRFQVRAM